MTVAAHPALFHDADETPAEPTLRDLTATLTKIRDAAEHLLTTLSDAARAATALADADDREETDASLDPSCARNRHWFTYYRQVGTSSPTCTRPGCDVPNARYNPVNDPHVKVTVLPSI